MAAPVSFSRWLGCGFALALIENTPVLLTCPLLESVPLHLWEIAAQALDVGGIPCTIEPLEHPSQVFVLGTQDVWWKPLIADFAAHHLGQDDCAFFTR